MKKILLFFLLMTFLFLLFSCVDNLEGEIPDDKEENGENTEGEGEKEESFEYGNEVGKRAYALDVDLLLEDGKVNIENYRGKAVVINFWGTWCGPCKSELVHFNELAEEYSDSVVFLLVHSTDKAEDPVSYVTRNFPSSNMIFAKDEPLGSSDKYYRLLGGAGYYPRTLVLDTDGVITFVKDGALTKASLKAELDKALVD